MTKRHAQTFPGHLGGRSGKGLQPLGLVVGKIVKQVQARRNLNLMPLATVVGLASADALLALLS